MKVRLDQLCWTWEKSSIIDDLLDGRDRKINEREGIKMIPSFLTLMLQWIMVTFMNKNNKFGSKEDKFHLVTLRFKMTWLYNWIYPRDYWMCGCGAQERLLDWAFRTVITQMVTEVIG